MTNCSTTATNPSGFGFFIQGSNIRLNNLTASGVSTGMFIDFASSNDGSVLVENCTMSPTPGGPSVGFEVSLSGSPSPLSPLTFINCLVPGLDSRDKPFDFVAVPATTPVTLIGCKAQAGSQAADVFTSTPSQVTILSCDFPAGLQEPSSMFRVLLPRPRRIRRRECRTRLHTTVRFSMSAQPQIRGDAQPFLLSKEQSMSAVAQIESKPPVSWETFQTSERFLVLTPKRELGWRFFWEPATWCSQQERLSAVRQIRTPKLCRMRFARIPTSRPQSPNF